MKPPIKDTPKEDKPPNKGQAKSILVYTLYRKSPLKEDNLSTKDKTAGPESVLIKRFYCIFLTRNHSLSYTSSMLLRSLKERSIQDNVSAGSTNNLTMTSAKLSQLVSMLLLILRAVESDLTIS